ncbi:MAG: glucoamylase family protein [Gemmatimonadales bacterium]
MRRNDKASDRKLVAPIRGQVLGHDRLAKHARNIARKHKLLPSQKKVRGPGPLLARLDDTREVLAEVRNRLNAAAERGVDISPAGDWLLDNAYVIQEHIREIRTSLPSGYYQELPKLATGKLADYPRVYDVAIELIGHTEGHLSLENVTLFVSEYQKVALLNMGELWAVPTMLRLGLIENIRRMSLRVTARLDEVEAADEWARRLAEANAESPEALGAMLSLFIETHPPLSPAFVARFLHQVRGYQANFTPLIWLEQWIAEDGPSAEEAVTRSNRRVAATQVTVANCITSLRTIARLDWKDFVESQSATEKILRNDPSGHYRGMTFSTRDHYRHVIEHIAKRTRKPEEEVAKAALALSATPGAEGRAVHIGYYILDEGRGALEKVTAYTPPFVERLYRFTQRRATLLYFGGVTAVSIATLFAIVTMVKPQSALSALAVILLAAIPASEVAVSMINQLVTLLIPPHTLPKLEFRETGIPGEYQTAVVVPTLFASVKAVTEALDHLEVQYLANRDKNLRFAILSDFTDSPTETREGDAETIAAAVAGVTALNAKYRSDDGDMFLLFHRPRLWNEKQGVWMGWERKRGKLGQFNRFLRGQAADAFSTIVGDTTPLSNTRYVITLDSDTVLPRDAAETLVGAIAHPLNVAEYDPELERIVKGYGIVQPRVGVSLTSAYVSQFAAIHSGHPGVDPYTTAVSDVYQDLFSEGSFTGKGIYDVDAFEKATHGRFPENTLLSHDLIEGAYSRAALATDIEVYDDYPARYLTYTRRKHRWIRGDWQLIGWLRRFIPGPHGRVRNRLSAISRWKILDNLRRSTVEIAQLILLVAGWFVLPGSPLQWTAIVLWAIAFPWVFSLLLALVRPPRDQSWLAYYTAVGRDAGISAQQFALTVVFLPHQAAVSADAIIRTLIRMLATKRNLLEWQTASQVERAMARGSTRAVWRRMWPPVALSVVLGILILLDANGVANGNAIASVLFATTSLLLLWLVSPAMAVALSAPATTREFKLSEAEKQTTLRYARLHWDYFATFATNETQWLAPDNFQEDPEPVVAARTSPTNIGLQLLSIVSAHDLGFIDASEMIDGLERVFRSLERMRRYRGHFYNWYELRDLHVLEPGYISTVDSGNLAGHLMALKQACLEKMQLKDEPVENVKRLREIAERARTYVLEMDFKFLFDDRRKVFSIGYNQAGRSLDNSYYDLLASESHLTSYMAIAKNDVPVDHWFRLGRGLAAAGGTRTLISWSGSMFEYLMPSLVLRSFPSTLLNQTHHGAVKRQISYGGERGVPWGLSESAYNVRDRTHTYQYKAFGVPDLALKRGLSKDLVIAPYASALAMLIEPHQALRNLATLEAEGALGPFGFRDAIDYTRPTPGSNKAVVQNYMAHHLGMSLVAFDNALNANVWQRRFHSDAMVRSAELMLQERIPRRLVIQDVQHQDESFDVPVEKQKPSVREFDSADTPQPRIAILGNVPYTTIITNAGGGATRFGHLAVNRWRNDGTRDDYGQWCYVKDVTTGNVWSAAYQPVCVEPAWYRVRFASDRAIFHRRDGEIETQMEIAVSSEGAGEIRRITVFNRSSRRREIELTSYAEIVIAPVDADRTHPAFGNLFVQTEWLEHNTAILAMRRPRSAADKPVWCGHVLAVSRGNEGAVSCETDRAKFIGRGRSDRDPLAMDQDGQLSGRVGAVLDPIFAIRTRLSIPAGASAEATFTTFMADDQDQAMQLADLYNDPYSARRALDLSWAQAQAELRELGITPSDAALYQELAGHLLFPHAAFKALPSQSAGNTLGQAELWGLGISGDVPILLATINSPDGLPSVRQLLRVHHYWRLKGVMCDLVILNRHPTTYLQELTDELTSTVMASSESGLLDRPGGVFIRRADLLTPEDIRLLHSVARIQVDCDGLGLGNFLEFPNVEERYEVEGRLEYEGQIRTETNTKASEPESAEAESGSDLQYFNGFGGFNGNNEYEIRLTGDDLPPAPWINVIANAAGGFIASETGAGATWVTNSYFFRLSPWHNDPVRDRPGECIYLRDDNTGRQWTPTPEPIREAAAYTVRHGAGQSTFEHVHDEIVSSLRMGMPERDPVKLQVLTLTNSGNRPRRLTMVSYVEWVLGTDREKTQSHVRTSLDPSNEVMLARNYFHSEFAEMAAFCAVSEPLTGYTASRREFLGRNGTISAPGGLSRRRLSAEIGDTVDPCAALETRIELLPGETKSIAIILGAARGSDEAIAMASRYRTPELAGAAIDAAVSAWRTRLDTITVRTPEPAFDLMVNQWSFYQALSCRMWGRTALYQSSGAFGFRDQLQDVMAFTYADPGLTREHIVRAASRQFEEGDVQHWWHPHSGRGVRTRFSDDLVWMPFVINHYLSVTHDSSVLDEPASYLTMRPLNPGEDELYDLPETSKMVDSVFDHCVRALNRACTTGEHGLPLIGSGDWNDGMNRVGIDGKGESVWLAWFLITTLRGFAKHAEARGHGETAADFRGKADAYSQAIEQSGWDGEWYRRAYYDDGAPLGSSANEECKIDSIAQSWSVISKAGDAKRSRIAMRSLNKYLVREDAGLIMLLTPPFNQGEHDPGYIQGYLPGVRENGAQYTHAALWVVLATAQQGDGDRAMQLYQMINPVTHGLTPEDVSIYKVEPYVVAADVYTAEGHLGRGGWTWYTGSASWLYRVALEAILGFRKRGDTLELDPCIPASWKEFSIEYRHGNSTYRILVRNPSALQRGKTSVTLDGTAVEGPVQLASDGQPHDVVITLTAPK